MQKSAAAPTGKLEKIGWALATVLLTLLSLLAFLCFFSACWYVNTYGRIGFDSVLYTLTNNLNGVDRDLIFRYLLGAALPAVLCAGAVCAFFCIRWRRSFLMRMIGSAVSVLLSLVLIVHAAFNVQLVDYLISSSQLSTLYESYYVDPQTANIQFPTEKRNLVYILCESMETSYLDKGNGGGLDYDLIPELSALAKENVNFSHNSHVGGFREVPGASWTIGAMVAHTAGVPLKVPDGIADWQNGYGADGVFLPGLYTLFNVLGEQDYYQALMVGSVASFGGREAYYESHGVDKVYDLSTAYRDGIVPNGYWNKFWGMEDKYLFEYAKQELTEISQGQQPFAFTLLTVDTHHIGGFTCSECGDAYGESYENAIACSSRQVAQFLAWLQDQPFYENTTVVISGDHCSMDSGYFQRNVDGGYERHVYNCFINAAATPVRTENRNFSALDMFPTTLAAMGCTIEGERLGLGTNLFSETPTMIERVGYTPFCTELAKRSDFYTRFYE